MLTRRDLKSRWRVPFTVLRDQVQARFKDISGVSLIDQLLAGNPEQQNYLKDTAPTPAPAATAMLTEQAPAPIEDQTNAGAPPPLQD